MNIHGMTTISSEANACYSDAVHGIICFSYRAWTVQFPLPASCLCSWPDDLWLLRLSLFPAIMTERTWALITQREQKRYIFAYMMICQHSRPRNCCCLILPCNFYFSSGWKSEYNCPPPEKQEAGSQGAETRSDLGHLVIIIIIIVSSSSSVFSCQLLIVWQKIKQKQCLI